MAREYPNQVDEAIAAAVARGESRPAIQRSMERGTLPGLRGVPWEIAERTLRHKIQRVKERRADQAEQDARREESGPSLAEMFTWGHNEVRALADQGKSAHEIIREVDFLPCRDGTMGNIPQHAADGLRFEVPEGGPYLSDPRVRAEHEEWQQSHRGKLHAELTEMGRVWTGAYHRALKAGADRQEADAIALAEAMGEASPVSVMADRERAKWRARELLAASVATGNPGNKPAEAG